MTRDHNSGAVATMVLRASLAGVTTNAILQTSSGSSTEHIAFDRPEEWAMKYFTPATR